MTTNPLEAALLPDIPTTSDNAHKHRARRCLVEVCRFVLCLVLQFLASVRSLLLPVMAGLGTAGCFVAAKDAQEIVLNSVAIAFVFEVARQHRHVGCELLFNPLAERVLSWCGSSTTCCMRPCSARSVVKNSKAVHCARPRRSPARQAGKFLPHTHGSCAFLMRLQ